jgi:hypothetical protein
MEQGVEQGNIEHWCWIEHRDISVKHTTSPSRRGWSAASCCFTLCQIQSATSEHKTVRRSATHLNPSIVARSLLRHRRCGCRWLSRISLVREARPRMSRLRNFDTEPLSSYCYELQPYIARKASLTRAPPPICTSAPGSQTALIWRAEGRCELINSYIMAFF